MRRLALLVTVAACRTISPAPPGTPPLVVDMPSTFVSDTLRVGVSWEARCVAESSGISLTTRNGAGEHVLGASTSSDRSTVACNQQGFTARASCDPGPCTVVQGLGGTSRELKIGFGRPGKHRLTLVIDNGEISKTFTSDVEALTVDAIRIGCAFWDGETQRPCEGRVFRPGTTFSFRADAFSGGTRLDAQPHIAIGKLLSLGGGRWQAVAPGRYDVQAYYDGVASNLTIVVAP